MDIVNHIEEQLEQEEQRDRPSMFYRIAEAAARGNALLLQAHGATEQAKQLNQLAERLEQTEKEKQCS